MSGTANSIRNSGVGSGSIKQYGYKKENGKLVIDEDEAAEITKMVNLYLNKSYSLGDIANYLNKNDVKTRYEKLTKAGIISYQNAGKLQWTDGSVGRLFHKRLLTGYITYGKTAIQLENLRIIDKDTFEALQIKMEGKRKTLANAAKWENFLKGKLVCGYCGGAMIMHKGKSKITNHYKCFNHDKCR
jgi:hypothetical protein